MDKITKNVHITISHGRYSFQQLRHNSTMLEALNIICKEASEQNKEIMYAKMSMTDGDSLLLTNKSL
jgi:hypothetical protein